MTKIELYPHTTKPSWLKKGAIVKCLGEGEDLFIVFEVEELSCSAWLDTPDGYSHGRESWSKLSNNTSPTTLVVYYRKSEMPKKELECIESTNFITTHLIGTIPTNSIVIPRYSLLPFHRDLYEEVSLRGATLINTPAMHEYVADLESWYEDLQELTPKSWFRLEDVPNEGPFIVKGKTNSRKDRWKNLMYAENKEEAINISCELMCDSLLSKQGIVVRKYEPLVTFDEDVSGRPVTEEFRYFCLDGKILARGYYWSNFSDSLKDAGIYPDFSEEADQLVLRALEKIKGKIRFVVVDVAKTVEGKWIVIELNDGCMSGTSDVPLEELYDNLYKSLVDENVLENILV